MTSITIGALVGGILAQRSRGLHTWSMLVAAAVALVSILGLAFGASGLYATERADAGAVVTGPAGVLVPGFVAQDALNIAVGVPILLLCIALSMQRSLIGRLLLGGALFNVIYVYMHYLIGAPFSMLFVVYALVIAASAYALVGTVVTVDVQSLPARLDGVPVRVVGGMLVALALVTVGQDASGAASVSLAGADEVGAHRVWGADFAVAVPAMLLGGVLLWRREPLGFFACPGLLLSFAAFSTEIAAMLLFQPQLAGRPTDLGTAIGLLFFAVLALVPLAIVIRSVTRGSVSTGSAHALERATGMEAGRR